MPSISELAIVHGRPGAIAALVANATELSEFTRFPGRIRDIDEHDFGKFVRQVDTGQFWCLVNWSPIVWAPVTGTGVDLETLTNAVNAALGTALNGYLKRDGSLSMTGVLNFGLHQATGLSTATHDTDAVPFKQMNDRFDALHATRFKTANNLAMQAIPTALVGDDCVVSSSSTDYVWLAVAANKYAHGQNSLAGTGIDWLYQIDRIPGLAQLVAGHASVYITNFPADSVVEATYRAIIGQPGTLYSPTPTSTGFEIYSTAGALDGSLVAFSCVLGA